MKMKFLVGVFLALINSSFHTLLADTLLADNISISGNIEIETDDKTGKPAVLPLTIANLLYLLEITGTAGDMRYYYDTTHYGYVIAPKGVKSGGAGTPAVILLTIIPSGVLGTSFVYWHPNAYSYVTALTVNGLGGVLSGTAMQTSVYPHATTTTTTKFIVFGTTPAGQTTMSGSIVDSYPTH